MRKIIVFSILTFLCCTILLNAQNTTTFDFTDINNPLCGQWTQDDIDFTPFISPQGGSFLGEPISFLYSMN